MNVGKKGKWRNFFSLFFS